MLLGEMFADLFEELEDLIREAEDTADELEAEALESERQDLADYYDDDLGYLENLVSAVLAGDAGAYAELYDIQGALGEYGEWADIAENALAEFEERLQIAEDLETIADYLEQTQEALADYDDASVDVVVADEVVASEVATQEVLADEVVTGELDLIDVLSEVAALVEMSREADEDERDVFAELAAELYPQVLALADQADDSIVTSAWDALVRVESWSRGDEWVELAFDVEVVESDEQPEGRLHSAYDSVDAARAAIKEIGVDAFIIWEADDEEIYLIDIGTGKER